MNTNKKKNPNDKYRVTLKTAIALRKIRYPQYDTDKSYFLGKGVPTLAYGELLDFKVIKGNKHSVAAPTVHEVMDWLREKKCMFVEVTRCPSKPLYFWRIKRTDSGETVAFQADTYGKKYVKDNGFEVGVATYDNTKNFKSYKKCCEAAILGYLYYISQQS